MEIDNILEKTQKMIERFDELTKLVSDPLIIANNLEWKKLVKERSGLEEVVEKAKELKKDYDDLKSCKVSLEEEKDHEMRELFHEEIARLEQKTSDLVEEIKILLLPKDENDDGNIIMEIRAAAGGEESALFATELMRMYNYYAEQKKWSVEIVDVNETELGGVKEATFVVKGKGAYARLKYEAGVHRVQRVPETETQGRIHTSTATVAVLPEVEDVDFEIKENDLRIDTYRSSGAGGQHINKTDSAIRLTHIPTGFVVTCQDQRSQLKNKEKAMNILKSKLYDYYQGQRDSEFKENRKNQVGTGDRSERVRTYNYPQGRVTDHRVGVSSYDLQGVLNGNIDIFIDALIIKDRTEKLAQGN